MAEHLFVLEPGIWTGEGKIQLNMFEDELNFLTRWDSSMVNGQGFIECIQEVQVKGVSDIMHNQFSFFDITPTQFSVQLENIALGKVTGKGLISSKVLAWEFRVPSLGFEGFEFYEKQSDGSYLMRAEYSTSDEYRTLIRGRLYKQKNEN